MTATGTGRGSNNSRAEAGAVLERLHLVINQRKEADPHDADHERAPVVLPAARSPELPLVRLHFRHSDEHQTNRVSVARVSQRNVGRLWQRM